MVFRLGFGLEAELEVPLPARSGWLVFVSIWCPVMAAPPREAFDTGPAQPAYAVSSRTTPSEQSLEELVPP